MTELDHRLHVYRPDLADECLRGKVEAAAYVVGQPAQFNAPTTPIFRAPRPDAMQISQGLMGQTVRVFETKDGWSWVQMDDDGYVGYVGSGLGPDTHTPTHRVHVPSTLLYPKPDLKSQPVLYLPMNAKLRVTETVGNYFALANGGFVFAKHLAALNAVENDFVAVAEGFLNAPYLWGGKTIHGLDCSGLVQTALNACGITCPRDTDMQEQSLGHHLLINDLDGLQRGDLVFWAGHVGIMFNESHLLHANGFHMQTVIEPLAAAATRIAESHKPITSIKRL